MSESSQEKIIDLLLKEAERYPEETPSKNVKLSADFIISILNSLLEVPKPVLQKYGHPLVRAVALLASQIVSHIKTRKFSIFEEAFYFLQKLKGCTAVDVTEKATPEAELLWKDAQVDQHIDVLRNEQLKESKLIGWVPAIFKERDPKKGIRVEFRDEKTENVWIEKSCQIALPENYTKDWDWRYQIQQQDKVDACDDYGHWYLSTVLGLKTKSKGAPSYELILDKVLIGYRYYTPNGTKHDSQGNAYEGWSAQYDEWVSVNSLRIERPLSVCNEGAVYCKNQLDRSADEATNASDALIHTNQGEVQFALERSDYESPYIMIMLINEFCKCNGFADLNYQLTLQQQLGKEITPQELIGLIKGIASITPLLHKKFVSKQIKGCHTSIMELVTQQLNSKLPKEEIKFFIETSYMLSRITGSIYTQRTKQEKMEQFIVLLTQACFNQPEEGLYSLGEELVEKLCFYKEFPFRTQYQNYLWLNDTVGNKPLFWKKFEENLSNGFDYSCMTLLHLISSIPNSLIEENLRKINRSVIINIILRMKDVLPKNLVSLQVSILRKIMIFYEKDKEIFDLALNLLWDLTNPALGYTKSIVEESKSIINSLSVQSRELLNRAYDDILKLKLVDPSSKKYQNISRSLNYIHDSINAAFFNRDYFGDTPKKFVKEKILSEECLVLVLNNFEKYYKGFALVNAIPAGQLIGIDHKRLTNRSLQLHQKEVSCFLRFFKDYDIDIEQTREEIKESYLKRVWDLLVVDTALEEDAIHFYTIFSEIMSQVEKMKEEDKGKKMLIRQFFMNTIAKFQHKITELPKRVLSDYLYIIFLMNGDEKSTVPSMISHEGKYIGYFPSKPIKTFDGIQFFFNLLINPKPSELAFTIISMLGELYYQSKKVAELSLLAQDTIERICYMVNKGFSTGRLQLLSTALSTLEYIVNFSELLGDYMHSCYELNKSRKISTFKVVINKFPVEVSLPSNSSLRVLMRKIYKQAKISYGQTDIVDSAFSLLNYAKLSDTVAEVEKTHTFNRLSLKLKYILFSNGQFMPEVKDKFEKIYETLVPSGELTPELFEEIFDSLIADQSILAGRDAQSLFEQYDTESNRFLSKAQFVKVFEDVGKISSSSIMKILLEVGFDLENLCQKSPKAESSDVPIESLPRYWISNSDWFNQLLSIYKLTNSPSEKEKMNRLLDSLVPNQEIIRKIIEGEELQPALLPYSFKCAHSLLLEKPQRMSPFPGMQARIREWKSSLAKTIIKAPFFSNSIFKANLDILTSDICIDAYKIYANMFKDILVSLYPGNLEKVQYSKLSRIKEETSGDYQANLVNLLGSIKLKSVTIKEDHIVQSKYIKKIVRLSADLMPAASLIKANCISPDSLINVLEFINYWLKAKVTDPLIQILKILKYEILVCPEGICMSLDEKPEILTSLIRLCAEEDENVCTRATNIIFLITQEITSRSKVYTIYKILELLSVFLKSLPNTAMCKNHIYLLQLINAVSDCCTDTELKSYPYLDYIKHISTLIRNSNNSGVNKVRYIYSTTLYKLMNYYIWFKGAELVMTRGRDIKNSIDFVKIIMDVRVEIEELLASNFQVVPNHKFYITMLLTTIYERIQLPIETVMNDVMNLMMNVIPKQSQTETDQIISQIAELYNLMKEKDVFLHLYWEYLSKRISLDTYISIDADTKLIEAFKKLCQTNNLRRIAQLLQDYETSKVINEKFVQFNKGVKEFEMNVKVFSVANWPATSESYLVYSPALYTKKVEYEKFYVCHFPERRLTWVPGQSTVEVSTQYLPKPYYFVLSLYQYSILMVFESVSEITYCELRNRTGINKTTLDQHLKLLMNPKLENSVILKEKTQTPICEEKEILRLNSGYTSVHLKKLFVPQPFKQKQQAQVREPTQYESIAKERMYIVEALIMKIMKGKKRESHNDLIAEVMKQIKDFPVDSRFIKERIESLIERDYLNRDSEDRSMYVYVP